MDWQNVVNLGAAGAVIAVVKLFLAHLKADREARDQERHDDRLLYKEFSDTMRVVAAKCPGPTQPAAGGNNGSSMESTQRRQ